VKILITILIAILILVTGVTIWYFSTLFPSDHDPHTYFNHAIRAENLHLSFLEEYFIKRGLEKNTIENLQRAHPNWAEGYERQQKLEFGWLYSQYAYVLMKKAKFDLALLKIKEAVKYRSEIGQLNDDDYLRLGILEYLEEDKGKGWENFCKALLMDSQIEHRNPTYTSLIHKIIKDHHGENTDIEQFITNYRIQNAKILPELPLVTLDNKEVNLAEQKGKVIFINFFSTYCGSCRHEISNLKNFYKKYLANDDVYMIFILNELKRNEKAKELLESNEIKNANLVLYKGGSVYDLIPAEPTTWIVGQSGKIIYRHIGYRQGDEVLYEKEVEKLIQDRSSKS